MIFSDNAPAYWAANLPVIPLMVNDKRPAISRWQLHADVMPTVDEQGVWMSVYPNANMGLPLGPCAGLVAIDIDTDDPKILSILHSVLPKSPWVRVGKKGMVQIYRYNNERTARIKGMDGGMIVEILSKGTQIVLPPSIHPDTGRPYTSNCALVDVLSIIPTLPNNIESVIRSALKSQGVESNSGADNKVTSFVPAGARDNTMTWHAGLMARGVLRGERTLLEALGEMDHWATNFVEQVVGDPLSADKAQKKLIEFLVRDVTGERRAALPFGWDDGLSDDDREKLGLSFSNDDEVWKASAIIDFLAAEFSRTTDVNSDIFMSAVELALDRMVRAGASINPLDEERIIRFITSQSGGQLTVASVKKQVNQLRRGEIAGENHTEIALAVGKQLGRFGEIRHHASRFWQWKGGHWAVMDESYIMRVIAEDYGFYPACRRHSDYGGVMKTMRELLSKPLCTIDIKGLNFANGFLTDSMDLIDHNPDQGMTYVLPYRYVPEIAGHMPIFNQFLHDSWGEDPDFMDKLAALQEAMGATLFGAATRYQRAFCLFGQPGSGKSRVISILQGLLPREATSSVPPQDWADKFLPAAMFGKLLNFAGELSETRNIPGESFKQIVVGEEITSQFKNQTPFQFIPMAAHWFSSNHLPKTKDSSDGFNRRWLILEFMRRVDPSKMIVDLDKIILSYEREAIAAWAVQGYMRLKETGGYTLPASHQAAQEEMARDNNSVRFFLGACPDIIIGEERHKGRSTTEITAEELHSQYWAFCLAKGITARVSQPRFVKLMDELKWSFPFQAVTTVGQGNTPHIVYRNLSVVTNGR